MTTRWNGTPLYAVDVPARVRARRRARVGLVVILAVTLLVDAAIVLLVKGLIT